MTNAHIRKHCMIDSNLGDLLQQAMEQLSHSARAYDRILKVARTIADLAAADRIEAPHLLEAIQYRSLDRTVFFLNQGQNSILGPATEVRRPLELRFGDNLSCRLHQPWLKNDGEPLALGMLLPPPKLLHSADGNLLCANINRRRLR